MRSARLCNQMTDPQHQKGGSFGSLLFFLVFLLLTPGPQGLFAAPKKSSLRLLYFFNISCNHCRDIKPFIFGLSKEYTIEGWISSAQDVKDYPFPVKVGSRELAPKYHVYGVPSIVVLKNGQFSQLVAGAERIQSIKPLLRAFDAGAINVTDAADKKAGEEVFVAGFVKIEGKDLKSPKVFIIDHSKKLAVAPWLPGEAVKSRFKKTSPRLLSQVSGKAVALKGKLLKAPDGGLRLQVKEEIRYDQDDSNDALPENGRRR